MNLNKKTKKNLITYGTIVPLLGILGYLRATDVISGWIFWGAILGWAILITLLLRVVDPEGYRQELEEYEKEKNSKVKVKMALTPASIAIDALIVILYIIIWVLALHRGLHVHSEDSLLGVLLVLTFVIGVFVGQNYLPWNVKTIDGKPNLKRVKAEMWRNRIAALAFTLAAFGLLDSEWSMLAKAMIVVFGLLMVISGYFIRRIKYKRN